MNNTWRRKLIGRCMAATAPAVLLGAAAMINSGVSPVIWMQNIVFMLLGAVLAYLLPMLKIRIDSKIIVLVSVVLLVLSLTGQGTDGVHRWLRIPGMQVNIAFLVLPVTLAAIYELLEKQYTLYAYPAIMVIAVVLFIQPDASQLGAFSLPAAVMLLCNKSRKLPGVILTAGILLLTVLSWLWPDGLAPVSYVEGIIGLLRQMGLAWAVLGVIFLLLIPLNLICHPQTQVYSVTFCVGLYYTLVLTACIFGNYPVPLMGYGISPIAGYWIVVARGIFPYIGKPYSLGDEPEGK